MTATSGTRAGAPVAAFFTDPGFDFGMRCALGATGYGVGDPGSVLATAAAITDGDRQSWFDAWTARGDRFAALAGEADPHGAVWAQRSASAAYSRALEAADGLPGGPDAVLLPTFRRSRECWEAMVDASQGRFVRMDVDGPDGPMPGWLLRPDATGAVRPTLVLTNGSDGSLADLWGSGAGEAVARDWNAFVYDGPGQQSMLFERGVPFRPDWETVLTPVVDALVARRDVDARALTAYGVSQAGYWLPRALAFEHRFVAAVADPGVVDVSTSWTAFLPPEMTALLDAGRRAEFDGYMAQAGGDPATAREFAFRARPYGITDPYDLFTAVRGYHLRDVADRIRTPLLITSPDREQFWPGQSEQLAALLTAPHEVAAFSAVDGADVHCEPLARRYAAMRMFAWLVGRLIGSSRRS
ncbi:hypothetical protein WIS52_14165 [Pseudonocardia nematodicida]|uniref:Dipeptidyl aminopeptidase n=1 Tax=Pseudonocardia nematodicida TaxID=1206997 RepID=A0ABV1KBS6_9PSEU